MFVVMTTREDLLTSQIMAEDHTLPQRKRTLALALQPPQMLVRDTLAASKQAAHDHFVGMRKAYNTEIRQLRWEMRWRDMLPPYHTAEARYLTGFTIRYVIVECNDQWAGLAAEGGEKTS